MRKNIYLLRHGQTIFNSEKRLQGHCDSSLTALGKQQARNVGRSLKKALDHSRGWSLYSSPLGRALATAEIVSEELGLESEAIVQDKRLIEMKLGDWEQQKIIELHQLYPGLCDIPDWYLHAPNAENFDHVLERLNSWLYDRDIPDNVIVVSHALTGAVLRGIYAKMDYEKIWAQDLSQDAYYFMSNSTIKRVNCCASRSSQARLSHH